MPVYEYRCTACGNELEVTQSFNDDPLTECPSCAGLLKKRFGVPGITFKGSGFYKTDSRGKGASSTSSTSSGDSASTGSTGDSSSATSTSTSSGSDSAASAGSGSSPTKKEAAAT